MSDLHLGVDRNSEVYSPIYREPIYESVMLCKVRRVRVSPTESRRAVKENGETDKASGRWRYARGVVRRVLP